ncbi:DUF5643 domain-containing protein [Anaerocolumna xylanovorans]|uniref:DUF5643 domain-containing protein n=1 Tax=Anaerocolumna xylanovorans DSM 12503 TaxID=1121345 RepID=A0A1M7Y149_9FIRM|nr:DUF5643 domain-containing protein [Anaerocolumna xylanovorans]SHO45478.1 hypothetical protein SAMN02745217_00969 [Anaerocolumna xylanovorans DSM 12503]
MFKKMNIVDKEFLILKLLISLLIFITITLFFSPIRVTHDSLNQRFSNIIFQNFENMGGNAGNPIKSISANNLTLNIYNIVFENQEILLKYDLRKDDNTSIPGQAISYAMVFDQNQHYKYKSEYNVKALSNDLSSTTLAVLTKENADTVSNYLNKTVKISINIIYKSNDDNQGLTQDFEFEYTPTQIYNETIIQVNREFSYLDKSIKVKQIILNGLYMRIECDYERERSSDMWCFFKAYDESGEEAAFYGASASENTSEYFYNNVSEKATKLYLYPRIYQYDATSKEKIIPLDEKIEIILPK